MASEAVFNTTELMESILALLPLPSLLCVQAVSKQWQTVIRDSLILQQKLFLKPAKDEIVWLVDITNLPAQQRPLRRDFKSFLRVKALVSRPSEELKAHHGLVVTPVKINPLFLESMRLADTLDLDIRVDRATGVELNVPFSKLKMLQNHSLLNMYLTQPPARNTS